MTEESKETPTDTQQNDEGIPESVALASAVNSATRGPQFGIFEQTICTMIYRATNSIDPLEKIYFITDAALMLEPDKQKSLKIDVEPLKTVAEVCKTLRRKTIVKLSNNEIEVKLFFGFFNTDENYKKHISPWIGYKSINCFLSSISPDIGQSYRTAYCPNCRKEIANDFEEYFGIKRDKVSYREEYFCKYCGENLTESNIVGPILNKRKLIYGEGNKKWDSISQETYNYELLKHLTESGYATVESAFLTAYNLLMLETLRKVTQSVRPEIYNDILKLYSDIRREVPKNDAL